MSRNAIETYCTARDAMRSADAAEIAAFLRVSHQAHPVEVEDVFPNGVPAHWQDAYDPTDAELEAWWAGPDAHEAHRAAWALHVEVRS
jgi:hypothetical protein